MCLCTVQLPPIDDDEFARDKKRGGGKVKIFLKGKIFLNF